jgi:AraC-like DNA-binding protein
MGVAGRVVFSLKCCRNDWNRYIRCRGLLNRIGHVRGAMLSMLALRISKEMRVMDTASLLAIEGLTLELIVELSRHSGLLAARKLPLWLVRTKEILHERSSETVSLNEVAKQVDIHPVHLAREFRKFYGCTLGEYLRELRIQRACRKLSSSDHTELTYERQGMLFQRGPEGRAY